MWKRSTCSIFLGAACQFLITADAGDAGPAKMQQFMPNPTGHGFDDKGMTKEAEFEQANQMGRFGIPDLTNPVTKELTDLDFEYATEGNQYLAIMFYSHAMKDYEYYALHWEKASMEMNEALRVFTSANITMARFDISEPEHAEIAQKHTSRDDMPTLKMFHEGEFLIDIKCPIVHNEIRQFIISQTIPSVMQLNTPTDVRKWKRRKQVNQANLKFLAYITTDMSKLMDAFHQVASELKSKIQFAQVTNQSNYLIGTKLEDCQAGDIMFFRDFGDQTQIQYTEKMNLSDMIEFIRQHNMPMLTNMGDAQEFRVRDYLSHPTSYRLLVFFKNLKEFEQKKQGLETLARSIRSRALVAYTIESSDDETNFDYTFWEVSGDEPAFLYLEVKKDRKYIYTGKDALDTNVMEQFIQRVHDHKIRPKLKTEVPPVQNTGPVRVVTTTTFQDEVVTETKYDALVLFHAPGQAMSDWMLDHVTKFAKVWRREKKLKLMSVDCNQNDILEFDDIATYPALFYLSAQDQTKAQSGRQLLSIDMPDMQDLMEFVMTQQPSLQRDEKVWARLVQEDEKFKGAHARSSGKQEKEASSAPKTMAQSKDERVEEANTQISGPAAFKNNDTEEEKQKELETDESPDTMFGDKYQALKAKILTDNVMDKEKEPKQKPRGDTFPKSFDQMAQAQKTLEDELKSLFKSTGFNLPSNSNLDTSKLHDKNWKWLYTLFFTFNLAMVAVFGEELSGAALVLLILCTCFFGLPLARRMYRRREMKKWLTKFYQQHEPSRVERIPDIMDMYSKLDNGMNKLKEDLIRKYVIETKKSK